MSGAESERSYIHSKEAVSNLTAKINAAMLSAGPDVHDFGYYTVNYRSMFTMMSEDEFSYIEGRIRRYHDSTILQMQRRLEEFLNFQEEAEYGYHGGHACFIMDVAPALIVMNATLKMNRDELQRKVGNAAYEFFHVFGSNRGWTDYAVGYMLGIIVDPGFNRTVSSSRVRWLTLNAHKLVGVFELLYARRSVDQSFCEALLDNASAALAEGVL